MSTNFRFRRHNLETLIGGVSPLDLANLSIESVEDAHEFLCSYGFDWTVEADRKELISLYQKALVFLKSEILLENESLPSQLTDVNESRDMRKLFMYVNDKSDTTPTDLRKWSGALLKVIHVIIHFSHDMYSIFPDEIQKQILGPIEQCITSDPAMGLTYLRKNSHGEGIKLYKFEKKPVKDFRSSILKLLAKRKLFALNLYDNIGVRFVTWTMFDAFRVLRFMMAHSLVHSFHTITDQAVNTIYPANLLLEVMDNLRTRGDDMEPAEVDAVLQKKLHENFHRAEYLLKENNFSGEGYKFIKFVCRKLIRVNVNGFEHRFFYPFEVQVLTKDAYLESIQGEQAHHEYKKRQRSAARRRLLDDSI
jgi:uncharacterized protein (TIGR04562 family)